MNQPNGLKNRKVRLETIDEIIPENAPYAMAYVRFQQWETPLRASDALNSGTVFESLVKPFTAGEVQA